MKNKFLTFSIFCFLILNIFTITSCLFADPDENQNLEDVGDHPLKNKSIPKEYWGTWIRMDTGDQYYIDSESIRNKKGFQILSKVQNGIGGFTRDSESIIRKGNTLYFKDGGVNRNFSFNVSGFEDTVRSFSRIGLGHQHIIAKRENASNKDDNETVKVTEDNKLEFTGAVSGDSQNIIISDDKSENQVIQVTPSYNGESMGTISLVDKDKWGFKVTYVINSDKMGYCYAGKKKYTLRLKITNVGPNKCFTSECTITCKDPNLVFENKENSYTITTLYPGEYKDLIFNVTYNNGDFTEAYKDVPLEIKIKDSKFGYTWLDQANLRFYRGKVPLYIKSKNIDGNKEAKLKGFIIYPDGRSEHFTVPSEHIETVYVPWDKKDYILAFSGADRKTEVGYVFGFNSESIKNAELPNDWTFNEITAYEDNDNVNKSARVDNYDISKAYLSDEDIDFYKINDSNYKIDDYNVDDLDLSKVNIEIENVGKFYILNDDGNGIIDYGETIGFDTAIMNKSENIYLEDLRGTMSISSNLVREDRSEFEYSTPISPDHYSTGFIVNGYIPNYDRYESYSRNALPYTFRILDNPRIGDSDEDNTINIDFYLTSPHGVFKRQTYKLIVGKTYETYY